MLAISTPKEKKLAPLTDKDRSVSCQLDAVDDRRRRPRRDLDPHEATEKTHNEKTQRERERGRDKVERAIRRRKQKKMKEKNGAHSSKEAQGQRGPYRRVPRGARKP